MPDPRAMALAVRIDALYGPALRRLKRNALRFPWDGRGAPPDRQRIPIFLPEEPDRILSVLLTFDVGYHNCGWWRNSLYDRCWHLSTTILKRGVRVLEAALETPELWEVQGLARAAFGDDVRVGWVEPPASSFDLHRTAPQSRHVYHVRIFVDPKTGQAIQPTGEVYDLVPFEDGTSPEKVFR
jgi:hypothetical protein